MGQDRLQRKAKGKRQRRREEIAATLQAYRNSGLSQAEFARQAGIKLCSLRNWLYRQRRAGVGGFAAVQLGPDRGGALTLRWPGGVELEIAVALDGAGTAALLRELLAPCLR